MTLDINAKDEMVMKLLHYFITEKNYNPVVLHGAQEEIWLENMDNDYKIVRIVSNYIHNNEQLDFDLFKTQKIVSNIKKKTLNLNMNVLSIYVDLGDNVNLDTNKNNTITCVNLANEKDISKYEVFKNYFTDIKNKLVFNEDGMELFMKITSDIAKKNQEESEKAESIFKPKTPYITYILIAINVLVFLYGVLFDKTALLINLFSTHGPSIVHGDIYRIFSGAFVHVEIFHILFNMYALYIIGSQVESFYGKAKYLFIYFFSIVISSLLSIMFNGNIPSIGASGAIFGLFGAMLYFGYNYRVYLGNTVIRQMLPIIIINLVIGFASPGIDNFAHIGGLVGGILSSMVVGLKYRENKRLKINGIIISIMVLAFLIYVNFFVTI